MVLNRAVVTRFDLPIHHRRGLSMTVCICIHFYFLLFSKENDELGRIDMQHKVKACFGTQSVAWVGIRCLISEKGHGKADDIFDDEN